MRSVLKWNVDFKLARQVEWVGTINPSQACSDVSCQCNWIGTTLTILSGLIDGSRTTSAMPLPPAASMGKMVSSLMSKATLVSQLTCITKTVATACSGSSRARKAGAQAIQSSLRHSSSLHVFLSSTSCRYWNCLLEQSGNIVLRHWNLACVRGTPLIMSLHGLAYRVVLSTQ